MKLAPWWKLGCNEIDDSAYVYSNDVKLEDMPFDTRLMNCLKAAQQGWYGYRRRHEEPLACGTVGEMRQLADYEVFGLDNLGKVSLKEFKTLIWLRKPAPPSEDDGADVFTA